MDVDGTILVSGILDRITRKGASISIQAGSHTLVSSFRSLLVSDS